MPVSGQKLREERRVPEEKGSCNTSKVLAGSLRCQTARATG